jgi:hypothetical protein
LEHRSQVIFCGLYFSLFLTKQNKIKGVQSVWDLGVYIFGCRVVREATFEKTISGLLSLIERERKG